jgi:hypothetical protein
VSANGLSIRPRCNSGPPRIRLGRHYQSVLSMIYETRSRRLLPAHVSRESGSMRKASQSAYSRIGGQEHLPDKRNASLGWCASCSNLHLAVGCVSTWASDCGRQSLPSPPKMPAASRGQRLMVARLTFRPCDTNSPINGWFSMAMFMVLRVNAKCDSEGEAINDNSQSNT